MKVNPKHNTGTYFDMRISRNKIPLMQKLLNIGILTWIIYGVVMIVYKIKIARAFLAYFLMAGK